MSSEPPSRRRIWVEIDWDAPGPAVELVGEFVRAARPSDRVELGLATGTLSETDAAARLVSGLNGAARLRRARGAQLPEVAVHEGAAPAGAEILRHVDVLGRRRRITLAPARAAARTRHHRGRDTRPGSRRVGARAG